jgi:uncharacterized repeat protein (TIGR01451 family)
MKINVPRFDALKLTTLFLILALAFVPLRSDAALSLEPLTWNVIGLDSNDPLNGPNQFPVGARVCSDIDTVDVTVNFVFDSTNAFINIRPGSYTTLDFSEILAGECVEAYFEIEVDKTTAAFDTQREYRVVANDATGSYSTPAARALYVERLISQSRNEITQIRYGTDPMNLSVVPPGGGLNLVLGNLYYIELTGGTATQGYEQFQAFLNFPNTIFQLLEVETTYSANSSPIVNNPNDRPYANACGWDNNINSPTYLSCVGPDGRTGGNNVVTLYTVLIIGGGGQSQSLSSLLYDFSGSSYHYNSDFSIASNVTNIVDPTTADISKSFSPNPTVLGGVSTLTITLSNPNAGVLSGYSFIDNLPPGMVIATPSNLSVNACGTPNITAISGTDEIFFDSGEVGGNSSCTIRLDVSTAAIGDYLNTTENLFVDGMDTGNNASAMLTVNNAPPPGVGVCGIPLASWNFPSGFDLNNPVPSMNTVAASASVGSGFTPTSHSSLTADGSEAWGSNGDTTPGVFNSANNEYFEFAVDTTGLSEVYMTFDAARRGNNGPRGIDVFWDTIPAPPETGLNIFSNSNALPSQNTTFAFGGGDSIGVSSGLNPTGNTYFRIYFSNSLTVNPGADAILDNVAFTGCGLAMPPTIAKSFSPNPIAVGGTSTLTFVLDNPNSDPLTGAQFNDTLPADVMVANPANASTSCGGAPSFNPQPGDTVLEFGSPNGGDIPALSSCTVSVDVTANTLGPKVNISGFLSTTETGVNPDSVATATLSVIAPPSISKLFTPPSIGVGEISSVTLTIENPNSGNAIFGVAFDDVLPAPMVVANTPNVATVGCGAPLFNPLAGAAAVSFSGGTIAAADFCVVSFDVTVAQEGLFTNITSTVSHIVNGLPEQGNSASANLLVNAPNPQISLLKEVGLSAVGPWFSFTSVALPDEVYYRFTIENTGDVPLSSITLDDPLVDTSACVLPAQLPAPVMANDDHIFRCVVGPFVAVSGSNTNTATAGGSFGNVPVSDSDSAVYGTVALSLMKAANPLLYSSAGELINYSFTVTNSGFAPLMGPILVLDDQTVDESCPPVNSVGDFDNFFDPGESLLCMATYVTTPADVNAGSVVNIAAATNGQVTSNNDTATINLALPELNVSKQASPIPFVIGSAASYSITVSNNGNTATTAPIAISDNLPAGISLTGFSGSNWSCSGVSSVSCTFNGVLAPTQSTVLTLNVFVSPLATGGDNSAVGSGGGDPQCPQLPRCTGSVPVPVIGPLLSTTKVGVLDNTVVPPNDQSNVGDIINYTITVTNNGNGPALGLSLNDPLLPTLSCTVGGNPVSLPMDLAAGASLVCTGSYSLIAGDINAALVTNTATASANNACPPGDACSATEMTPLLTAPVLSVSKSATPNPFIVGQPGSYSVTVTNTGNAATSAPINLVDNFATGISLSSFSGTDWNCSGVTAINCTFNGVLAPSASTVLTLNVNVANGTTSADNTAVVNGGGDPTCPDAIRCSGSVPVPVLAPALNIVKSGVLDNSVVPPSSQSNVGDIIAYTLTVTNTGNATATAVSVNDPLLPVLACTINALSVNLPVDLAPGVSLVCTANYALVVNDIDAGAVLNTATVTASNTCPPGDLCSDSENTPLVRSPLLSVSKSASPIPFVVGSHGDYTITVENVGNAATSSAITITDALAPGLSFVDYESNNWLCSGTNVVSCDFNGVLAPGASTSIVLTVFVDSAATHADNTAIGSGGGDPTCPQEPRCIGTVPVPVIAPLLVLEKSGVLDNSIVAPDSQSNPGDEIDYTITVANTGSGVALGVTVNDPLLPVLACTINALPVDLPMSLQAGESLICSGTYVLTAMDIDNGVVDNTAVVTASNACPPGPNCTGSTSTPLSTAPLLSISKTAMPNPFVVGETGEYLITVSNNGNANTSAPIVVTDSLATGVVLQSSSGTDWNCVGTTDLVCTFSGVLVPSASTQLTLLVFITPEAVNGDNTAVVEGGGDPTCPTLPRCTDSVPVPLVGADLGIDKFHDGDFMQGQMGAMFSILVTNFGNVASAGTVTVEDILPPGLTATAIGGSGWACTLTPLRCTRDDALLPGDSFPVITLTVDVAEDAPISVINEATVMNVGDPNPDNDRDLDPVDIEPGTGGVQAIGIPVNDHWMLITMAFMLLLVGYYGLQRRNQ